MSAAKATTVIDDQQIRVTTWTFDGPGDATGPHVHEYDYVVVPVTGGRFTVINSEGATREMTQHAGRPIEAVPDRAQRRQLRRHPRSIRGNRTQAIALRPLLRGHHGPGSISTPSSASRPTETPRAAECQV